MLLRSVYIMQKKITRGFGIHNFEEYSYNKGEGVWGSTLKAVIKKIDNIKINEDIKIYTPEQIINDLFQLLKNKTKKILEQRYNEMFS